MTAQKRNILYWSLKIAGLIVSCALPIWAICERFPLWAEAHGAGRSAGVGLILIGIVLLVIFRRTVFSFLKAHLNLQHAPPITVWVVLLIASYIFVYIGETMRDMTTVFWMGLIGCGIGNILTFVSDRFGGGTP